MTNNDKFFVNRKLEEKKNEINKILNELEDIEYRCSEDIDFDSIRTDLYNAVKSITEKQNVVNAHEVKYADSDSKEKYIDSLGNKIKEKMAVLGISEYNVKGEITFYTKASEDDSYSFTINKVYERSGEFYISGTETDENENAKYVNLPAEIYICGDNIFQIQILESILQQLEEEENKRK